MYLLSGRDKEAERLRKVDREITVIKLKIIFWVMPRLFLPNDKFCKGSKKCACPCVPAHWTLFLQKPTIFMPRGFFSCFLSQKSLPTTLTPFRSVIKCLFLGEFCPLMYVMVTPLLQHPQFSWAYFIFHHSLYHYTHTAFCVCLFFVSLP